MTVFFNAMFFKQLMHLLMFFMSKTIKRFSLVFVLFLTVALLSEAQNRSKTHDVYEALTGVDIKVDGKMSDWDGVFDAVVGTNGKPFIDLPAGDGGNKAFQEHDGGKWNGKDDHRTGIMMVWNPDAFYVGLLVTDDKHDDPPNGWNGDALQFALETSGKRKAGKEMLLYNVGLSKGKLIINNEKEGKNGLGERAYFRPFVSALSRRAPIQLSAAPRSRVGGTGCPLSPPVVGRFESEDVTVRAGRFAGLLIPGGGAQLAAETIANSPAENLSNFCCAVNGHPSGLVKRW